MSTLEKIKSLLSNQKTKLYAELKLDDGRVVATEDEQFMIGSEVMVIGDDGEATPLSAGSYTMSDGAKMSVDDNSKITDLGEEKEAEDVDAKKKDEYADAEDTDWAKTFEEMKDRLAKLEDKVFGKEAEEETEELAVESTTAVVEEKIEMSVDIITSLVEEVEELKSKLIELEKQPGAEGFTHTPENDTTYKEVDLTKLSSTERAAHYINNLK